MENLGFALYASLPLNVFHHVWTLYALPFLKLIVSSLFFFSSLLNLYLHSIQPGESSHPPSTSVLKYPRTWTMAILTELYNSPYMVQGVCVALVAVFITLIWDDLMVEIPHRGIPLVGRTWWELTNKKARARFTQSCRDLIAEGFTQVGPQRL